MQWQAIQELFFAARDLPADAWDAQMVYLAERGFRCIAHDRRGHGRSTQPWDGNEMDTYADDLATLVEALGLENAVHVGHSTGGGEVARYLGRHGTKRVAKAVLIGAVPPLMLKTEANPGGLPRVKLVHDLLNHPTVRGIGRALPEPLVARARALRASNLRRQGMTPDERRLAAAFFRDDVLKTQELIGRDLSAWLAD